MSSAISRLADTPDIQCCDKPSSTKQSGPNPHSGLHISPSVQDLTSDNNFPLHLKSNSSRPASSPAQSPVIQGSSPDQQTSTANQMDFVADEQRSGQLPGANVTQAGKSPDPFNVNQQSNLQGVTPMSKSSTESRAQYIKRRLAELGSQPAVKRGRSPRSTDTSSSTRPAKVTKTTATQRDSSKSEAALSTSPADAVSATVAPKTGERRFSPTEVFSFKEAGRPKCAFGLKVPGEWDRIIGNPW